ncbi:Uu.00g089340.m01.CDS01 [Anthostomella pinea]|uniref:Uu.00g089340.m01.CDS01 n=1 Tax=Anthostomella pinea TaxID=933095 RepID=A0AAI8VH97_9PEZI|nr:Uu.00g089340.m01.CDS01 [Anthostomella pinea]
MEGSLLIPPDRGAILGRAVWKTRYVVIGPLPQKDGHPSNLSLSQVLASARIKDVGGWGSRSQPKPPTDAIYLSVYKTKDDSEPIQQHSLAYVTGCEVQRVAHRKQGHVLPTMSVHISPDPATDKLRKRRSSRTAGLTSSKDSAPTTLWFRAADDTGYSLGDWARYIQSLIQPEVPGRQPLSPVSPISPSFINPFSSSRSDANEYSSSTSSAKSKKKSKLQAKSAGYGATRDPHTTTTYNSESPSIRSLRSDMSSSHASSMNPAAMGFIQQHYTTVHPSDLPSPAPTVGEYQEQFIEGLQSSSPPAPRQTILDRAFQLQYIPGSDREIPGEEKLSSIARFEALMREAEVKSSVNAKGVVATKEPMQSTWDEDDESDDDGEFGKEVDDDDEDDSDEDAFEQDVDGDGIGPSASRALQFIANRHSSGRPHWSQNVRTSVYSDSGGLSGGPSILRPHTAHSRLRPGTQRTTSQPQIPISSYDVRSGRPTDEGVTRRSHEKRHSTSDVKHLNFNEFTKRLSSSSSLLLVQTNASTGSSRGSSEIDPATTPRAALSPRGTGLSPVEREERCRWRGSVGVFGTDEGGFL